MASDAQTGWIGHQCCATNAQMDVAALRLFVDVARRGSFSAVARVRASDPSTVSRGIAALEAELAVRLFQRTSRTLALTEAGEAYLLRVAPLVDELDRARDEAASANTDPAGTLRLTTSVAFGQTRVVPLLSDFARTFPRLELELTLSDANLDLIAERIDMAIRLAPSYRADVIGVKLMSTRYRVVASPAYIAREGAPPEPEELSSRDCLRFPLPDYRLRWLFRLRGRIKEVPVSGRFVISNALALRSAVLDGLGPALLSDWLIDGDLASGNLVDMFPDYDVAATTFDTAAWLLYPSRDHLPRKMRVAIDFLREAMRTRGS